MTKNIIKILVISISLIFIVNCSKEKTEPNQKNIFSIYPANNYLGILHNDTTYNHTITITNKGENSLKLSDFIISGKNKDAFNIGSINNTIIDKNKKLKLNIIFTGKNIGENKATLKFSINNKPQEINLSSDVFEQKDLIDFKEAWLFLKDKPNSEYFISNPLKMLSAKAIERRNKQNIKLDEKDVPIDNFYYNLINSSFGFNVMAKSKWLNALHIKAPIKFINTLKNKKNIISKIEFADKSLNQNTKSLQISNNISHKNKFENITINYNYGETLIQINMLKTDFLHNNGFTGKGITMAIIDAGFPNVNTLQAFEKIRNNNQILGGYDFVNRKPYFYTGHSHGTHVLSTIAGYINNESFHFVGTAPDASFYLFITEDSNREVPLEESLWIEAAEKADSIGVNIINTSLGYTTFDNPKYNYHYSDLNGKTSFITRGAEIAASRGMILVNAAGNDGSNKWKYISMPADAKSVVTVGAITKDKTVSSFSSRGATADGRIKPDIMALGSQSAIIHFKKGTPVKASGTSFASPIMAGSIACLLQAFPNKNIKEIVRQIKQGSNKIDNPDNDYGYGIPNFEKIYKNLIK